MSDFIWKQRETFAGQKLPKVAEGVAQALAAQRAGKTPVVVADHSDRTGNSTWILEELIKQRARRVVVATIADAKAIEAIKATGKVGGPVQRDGRRLRRPVRRHAREDRGHARVPRTGTAITRRWPSSGSATTTASSSRRCSHQVMTPGIVDDLKIGWAQCDLIVIKSRVHFWRGFVEDGLAKAVVVIDAPGLGPADSATVPYKNAPVKDLYPLGKK